MLIVGLMLFLFATAQPVFSSSAVGAPEASAWLIVPAGASTATATMRITLPVSRFRSVGASIVTLTDSTVASPSPKVSFSPHGQTDIGDIRVLYFVADVTEVPQTPFSQQRTATLHVGNLNLPGVNYTITNRSPSRNDALKLFIPPNWSARSGSLPIIVSTGEAPATRLAIEGAFVEGATRSPLTGKAIGLCGNERGSCESDVSVSANSTSTVYLRYIGPIKPGTYAGTISVSALEYTSKDSNLTLYISSLFHTVTGVIAVVLGGFLAWWVKSYASNRVTRDQALLPIAICQERLATLDSVLKKATVQLGAKTPNLSEAVAGWTKQLNPAWLEARLGLPSETPSPFTKVSVISSDYTTFLSKLDNAITLLTIFIKEGVDRVVELTESGKIPSPRASKTIADIDDSYTPDLVPATALKNIETLISNANPPKLAATVETTPVALPKLSLEKMLLEIQRLNITAWFVLLAAASIGTILAVVLKPGFGKMTDYLLCFATSFGIPVVGGAAIPSHSTAATITTPSQAVSGSPGSPGM
jgi:hypothetical protein